MARPFRFGLERLLDVRRVREETASRDLALARRAVEEQDGLVRGLRGEADRAREERRALQGRAAIDLLQVRLRDEYQTSLERRLGREARCLEDLGRALEDRRRALLEARKGVKVLERFRERRLLEHERSEGRREQGILDEAARASAPERP